MATSAEKGSGDNAYIYFPLNSAQSVMSGELSLSVKIILKFPEQCHQETKRICITLLIDSLKRCLDGNTRYIDQSNFL